jgi:hypothetical protein
MRICVLCDYNDMTIGRVCETCYTNLILPLKKTKLIKKEIVRLIDADF